MKTITIIALLISSLFLVSCSWWHGAMTEVEQAEHYGMSLQEFREMKDAAARMNMSIEDHMKMTDNEHWDSMNNMMNDKMKNPVVEEDDDHMMR